MADVEKYRGPRVSEAVEEAEMGGFGPALSDEDLRGRARQPKGRISGNIDFYIDGVGEQASYMKQFSGTEYGKLPADIKLLMAIGQVCRSLYSGVYDTEDKKREFILKMMNKGKPSKEKPQGMSLEELEDMIGEAVLDGYVTPQYDGGIELTEEGLALVHSGGKKHKGGKTK